MITPRSLIHCLPQKEPERRRRPLPKPHIQKLKGVESWTCHLRGMPWQYRGQTCAPTPEKAYQKWRALMALGL